jgi:uncharacterized protein (DUF2236 family)
MAFPLLRGREMSPAEQDRYYEETLQLGAILRVPPRMMPATRWDYWDYDHEMVGRRLAPTNVALDIIERIQVPPLPVGPRALGSLAWPARRAAGHGLYLLMIGTMTEDARAVLGVRWSAASRAELSALMSLARPVHRRLPEPLRYLPLALHARRHARAIQAIRARASAQLS